MSCEWWFWVWLLAKWHWCTLNCSGQTFCLLRSSIEKPIMLIGCYYDVSLTIISNEHMSECYKLNSWSSVTTFPQLICECYQSFKVGAWKNSPVSLCSFFIPHLLKFTIKSTKFYLSEPKLSIFKSLQVKSKSFLHSTASSADLWYHQLVQLDK